jgi:hypothetical protein
MSVPRTPSGPTSGPASACPAGIRQSESSQSIDPTRASLSGRTSCCVAVSQSVFPKTMAIPKAALVTTIGADRRAGPSEPEQPERPLDQRPEASSTAHAPSLDVGPAG